jgi:hypothetical protein
VLHGKEVKVKQDSATMEHSRVKGRHEAWYQRAKGNGEEKVKPSAINHAKPYEDMDDQCHSFIYIIMPHQVQLINEQKLSAQY